MFERKTPLEKEWAGFLKREKRLVCRCSRPSESFWEKKLQGAVPEGLREKLETAFYRAFRLLLESGTDVIEKTYSADRLRAEYQAREYAAALYPARKNLAAGRKEAARGQAAGVAGACAEGAILGVLGIGLPDIPLFLAVILRNLYTLALRFGIDYEKPEEKELLLELMALSLERGEEFAGKDAAMNRRLYRLESAENSAFENKTEVSDETVRRAADALSEELLCMKFLQGIPVAGIIGGMYDGIYLKRITDYTALKLERRWLLRQELSARRPGAGEGVRKR